MTMVRPRQGVNAVVFSGFAAAHRVLVDIGKAPGFPLLDKGLRALLDTLRNTA